MHIRFRRWPSWILGSFPDLANTVLVEKEAKARLLAKTQPVRWIFLLNPEGTSSLRSEHLLAKLGEEVIF